MIVRGLETFLDRAVWKSPNTIFSVLWCFPLNLIHVLRQEQQLYKPALSKLQKPEDVNIKTCGLECLFEKGKINSRKISNSFLK